MSGCGSPSCHPGVIVRAPAEVDDPSAGRLTVCDFDECMGTEFPEGVRGFNARPPSFEGATPNAILVMPDGTRYSGSAIVEDRAGCLVATIELQLDPA